jgi:asparagine synthase (glutamine-hydrolysing)
MIFRSPAAAAVDQGISTMCHALRHRAVEQVLTCAEQDVAMGVVKQFESQQIFHSQDLHVVCDAELYNLAELIGALKADGCELRCKEEAEIIAHLYRRYGLSCVDRMRGVFSFALWDEEKKTFVAAVDRFGVKKLNYFNDGRKLLFASSIAPIARYTDVPRQINHGALIAYINFEAIPGPHSIFRHIYKLSPGHLLVLKDGRTECRKYWDMKYDGSQSKGQGYYAAKLRELIREAVGLHLRDDPVENSGAFLSGGTDSSTVVGMMHAITGQQIKAFSIGFAEEKYNEINYARITSNHFQSRHYEYVVTPQDTIAAIPILTETYDEPFGNSSAVPTYYCAKLGKDNNVNVMLAGDGGDELFAGNERYLTDRIFSFYHEIPATFRKRMIEPVLLNFPFEIPLVDKAKKYIKRSNIPNPRRFFSYHPLASINWADMFQPEFLASVRNESILEIPEQYYRSVQAGSDLDRLLYIDLKMAITDNDLVKVGRMAEAADVRVRFPFLDYKLAEFSGTIPAALKLKRLNKRYIFKRALEDFLPKEVIKKRKHGFGLPIGLWLRTNRDLKELARSTLLEPRALQRGYFKQSFMENLFVQHQHDSSTYYGDFLWRFLMLELWHRKHVDALN